MNKTVKISEEHHEMLKDIQEQSDGIGTPNLKEVNESSIELLYEKVIGDGGDEA